MDNSETVRVNGVNGGCVAEQGAVRKYSRDQLFELAKLIENYELIGKDLESMRQADWTKYELDTLSEERLLSDSLMSRQNSELAERDLDQHFGQQHRKLYRMTSSPIMKSAKMHELGQAALSSQARAKYARLIETISNGPGTMKPVARQPLGRTSSNNSRAPLERPGQLFSPLRRQQAPTGPEEPMSLPYSINSSGRARDSRWSRSGEEMEPKSSANSLLDDETLIKRIGGSNSNEQDDDDFDITSLLSITVLSDIRTIRQDLQTLERQRSQVSASSTRAALARSKSHEPSAARMPARSKTALDFNYELRTLYRQTPQQQLAAAVANAGAQGREGPMPAAQYFPVPGEPVATYSHTAYQTASDWPASAAQKIPPSGLFVCAEMAPPASASKPLQPVRPKPVDESVAKIIESFKAQVRARAAAEAPAAAPQKDRPAAVEAQGAEQRRSKSPERRINEAGANESRSSGGTGASPPRSPVASPAEPESGTAARVDNEVAAQANERTVRRPVGKSHIPRLIALQQGAKSNQNAASAKVTGAQDAQKDAKPAPGAGGPGKFVSQYKRLRGKSLADEVAECKSSA